MMEGRGSAWQEKEAGQFNRRIAEALREAEAEEETELQPPGKCEAGSVAPDGNEAVGAVLQLFCLCNPGKDVTICRADLEAVLHQHLGSRDDVASVLRLLESSRPGPPPERFDFLSYWHGMEHFFMEAGSWPRGAAEGAEEDVLCGMQRFRDGVLGLWSNQETSAEKRLSSEELLQLLRSIQESSQDPQYWGDVMQIVPLEDNFGLTLLEVSEAVCVWLNDFLRATPEDGERRGVVSPFLASQDGRERLGQGCTTPRLSQESLASASASPQVQGWQETFRGLCRGGGALLEVPELQRAAELCELLSQTVDIEDAAARHALSQLSVVHDTLLRTLTAQEAELTNLRRVAGALGERKRHLEAELTRAHEQLDEVGEASSRPEEPRRRTEALTRELKELRDQNSLATQELERLRAQSVDAERERLDVRRRDRQWQDRCSQLEQAADTAEGQARWMNGEVQRQAVRLSSAESQVASLRQEAAAWRWRGLVQALGTSLLGWQDLVAAAVPSAQLGPPAAPAQPSQETSCAAQLEVRATTTVFDLVDTARQKTMEDLQCQVRSQQAELRRLRLARDELLALDRLQPEERREKDELSPRQVRAEQRCTFLTAQLSALLRHTREVELLLDQVHDERLGTGPSPDVKRRLSIQQVHEEDEAIFNELSQRLYTLEVQKADADRELHQLQTRTAEQDRQLRAGQQRRDLLMAELGAARQASTQEAICKKPAIGGEAQATNTAEFYVLTDTSATSDTHSVTSGALGGLGSMDASSFLTPVQGTLRSSPKGTLRSAAKKVVAVHRFGFGATKEPVGRRGQ